MANIYVIKNKVNNMQYVGQCTCSVVNRFNAHIHDSNRTIPLHEAMDKLGIENFYCELLDTCSDDIRLDVETYYIDKLNTLQPNGYNVWRHSSDGFTGKHHSIDSLDKISKRSKEWWKSAPDEVINARNKKLAIS